MITFEIFRKKKKMEPILNRCWQPIADRLIYPEIVSRQPEQKLLFFGLVAYAIVYESAIAAEMSSDAAHYLARMQLGRYKLGKAVTNRVEGIFSGSENPEAQSCAGRFHAAIGKMIAKIRSNDEGIETDLADLARGFRPPESDLL